jgi:CHAT domain-containing protein
MLYQGLNKYLLLILILPFTVLLKGQSAASTSLNADKLVIEANTLKESGKLDLANKKLKTACEIYKKESKFSLYIKYSAEQGKNLLDNGQADDALKLLENLLKESSTMALKNDENPSLIYKYIGAVYYEKDDLLKATPYFKKALEIRVAVNPKSEDLFRDYYNLGVMYRNLGNFSASIKNLEKALELSSQKTDNGILSKIYLQLGTTHKAALNFEEAEDYLDLAIAFGEKNFGTNAPELAKYFMEKGAILIESATSFNLMSIAVLVLNKALDLYEKLEEPDELNYTVCLTSLGIANLIGTEPQYNREDEIRNAKRALPFLEKAKSIAKSKFANSAAHYDITYSLSSAYGKAGDFSKAEKTLNEAASLATKLYSPEHYAFAMIKTALSERYVYQEKYDLALNAIHEAIVLLTSNTELNNCPDWKLIENGQVESLYRLNDFIAKKASIYLKRYKVSKAVSDLELALKHLDFVDKIADIIINETNAEGGKMIVSDKIIDAYEMAISASIELSKVKKDSKFKEKAFYYSEKSKGIILLEAFQNSKAVNTVGLSDKIIKEEEALKLSIAEIKQQIFQLKSKGESKTDELRQLEKALFDKKQAYAAFVKKVEKENPEYFKMKFDLKICDLNETRKLLKKDQALLEYFSGNKSLFIFKISANEFEVFEVEKNQDLEVLTKKYRESIYGFYLDPAAKSDDAYEKYAKDFAASAYELYEKLIKPLGKLPKRLIVVPSGVLSNIPFEPLLSEKPLNPTQFKSHQYFGVSHILSYSYSTSLLSEMRSFKQPSYRKDFVGFAPSFGADNQDSVTMRNRRFALAPLNFNNKEVNTVRQLLGVGDVYLGKEATEERFKKEGANYKIIHFATHGMANDRDPDFSLLAFTEIADGLENEFLYVSDLYNMKLNADLVVLSACETGLGELRRGEGIISLARGFSYAGAKSIFTTLWSVNDQSTSIIIESFYKYLKEGKDKDEALHLAKLDFLKSADNNKAHPFLWAPYIIIGDTAPIKLSGDWTLIYLAIGLGAVVAIILAVLFRRKAKKKAA